MTILNDEPWVEDALCAQVDPEMFYPDSRGCNAHNAKRVCKQCPVQSQCLEHALDRNEQFGVWGGKTPRERQKIRRGRPKPVRSARTHCNKGHEIARVGLASNGACRECRRGWDRNRHRDGGAA